MRGIIIWYLLLLVFTIDLHAQIPQAQWGRAIGDGQGGLSKINDLVVDNQGNTYVVGTLRRLLDVDPGDGIALLSANSTDDIWMAAYTAQNELLWAHKLGNSSTENISKITLDPLSQQLLICGFFTNTLDFDPGPATTELSTFSASNADGFFASYSLSGQLNWVKQVGGASVDNVQAIITDSDGNIIITGNFSQTADLDPSANEALLTATGSFNDIFLAKYTSNGSHIWSFSISGSNFPDNGQALGILSNNSIVLGAVYQGDIDADPGAGTAIIDHANNYDALLACYDENGNYVWAGGFGSNGEDRINSISIDNQDFIYIGGFFNQTVDFDFSASAATATSAGNDDACLACYSAQGNLQWFRTWGSTGADEVQEIAVDNSGNIAVTGGFNGTVDMNPGAGTESFTSQSVDIFLSVFNTAGEFLRAIALGGSAFDFGNTVFFQSNQITLGGLFANSLDFNPGIAEEISSVNVQTAFFARYALNDLSFISKAAMQDRQGGDDDAFGMASDNEGNIYVCGSYSGSAFFAPASDEYPSNGNRDAYIAKYAPNGQLLLVITFGGAGNDIARSIEVDAQGNIYVTGDFENSMDVNLGSEELILTSAGNKDIFLIKYNNTGNLLWAKAIGGGAEDMSYALALNNNEDVFITGNFRASVDFDTGIDEFILDAAIRDCFIAGYTKSSGDLIWAGKISGSSSEYGRFIDFDQDNSLYAGGFFASTIDADPGAGVFSLTSNGSNDAFILKLNETGDFQWAFSLGASGSDQITSIQINSNNELYLGGYFTGTIDSDPNSTENNLTSMGNSDLLIMKFQNQSDAETGIPLLDWAYAIGGEGNDFLFDIHLSGNNLYLCGNMADTVNFNLSGNPNGIIGSPFSSVGFYATLNAQDASFQEAYQIMGGGQTFVYQIEELQNNLYLSGTMGGGIDIQPGPVTTILEEIGGNDGFVFKLGSGEPCDITFAELNEEACGTFILNGQNFPQSGQYTQTLVNAAGCDSIITLNLNILNATSASLDEEACGTFTLNSQNYSQSGQYIQTLINAAGCDSVIALNLTILNASSASLDEQACGTFILNGQNYSQSGQYTQTLINAAGCDSTITLNLSISQLENVSIFENGNILTASTENSIYQWINCASNEIIEGETNQVYEASSPGSYAVIVTEGACTDTSDCVLLTTVNNALLNIQGHVSLVPNPASHFIDIQLDERLRASEIKIYAADGKLCFKENNIQNLVTRVALNNWNEGLYFIIIQSQKSLVSEKFIITK